MRGIPHRGEGVEGGERGTTPVRVPENPGKNTEIQTWYTPPVGLGLDYLAIAEGMNQVAMQDASWPFDNPRPRR